METRDESAARFVLDGVPRFTYLNDGLCPFALCLKSCTDFLRESYSYNYILGTSGACFRMSWNYREWDEGNMDLARLGPEPFRHALRAVALKHRFLVKPALWPGVQGDDIQVMDDSDRTKALWRDEIVKSLRAGMPVLAFGVVGPPEVSLIAGYDESGEVLIGWAAMYDAPPRDRREPNGMYRKAGWFAEMWGIILLDRAEVKPDPDRVCDEALRWAHAVSELPKSRTHCFGRAAFKGWAGGMLKDADFPEEDAATIQKRRNTVWDGLIMLAERSAAAEFLETLAERRPDVAQHLTEAARLFREESRLPVAQALGGPALPLPSFAEPTARRAAIDQILSAGEKDAEAARHLALAQVERGRSCRLG